MFTVLIFLCLLVVWDWWGYLTNLVMSIWGAYSICKGRLKLYVASSASVAVTAMLWHSFWFYFYVVPAIVVIPVFLLSVLLQTVQKYSDKGRNILSYFVPYKIFPQHTFCCVWTAVAK